LLYLAVNMHLWQQKQQQVNQLGNWGLCDTIQQLDN
jgi:hypothetical protein